MRQDRDSNERRGGSRRGETSVAATTSSYDSPRQAANVGPGFAAIYLAACATVLLAVASLNVLGNADDLLPSPFRPATSDRAWKTRQLERLVHDRTPPEVLILGSSRVQQMCPAYVEKIAGGRTFNYAVTGGNVLDCLCQLRYVLRLGIRPRLVILNVDESMLMHGVGVGQLRIAGHPGLLREVPYPENVEIVFGVLEGLSLDAAWKNIRLLCGGQTPAEEVGGVLRSGHRVFLSDGYLIHHATIARQESGFDLNAVIQDSLDDAERTGRDAVESLDRGAFDGRMLDHLRELFTTARLAGIDVWVITTPEHPSIGDSPLGRGRKLRLSDLRSCVKDQCARFGFRYRDFSEVSSFDGDEREFWDGTHQTPDNMRRMTSALFGINPNDVADAVPSDVDVLRALNLKGGD